MNVFDVVVIGGGPAGCSVALSLQKNTPTALCLVLDDADPSVFKIGESLPPESSRLLHYLAPSLPKQLSDKVSLGIHTTCSGNASAWSSPILEERHSIMNPFGDGHHLNRSDFDETLRSVLVSRGSEGESGLVLERGSFKRIEKSSKGLWTIDMEVNGTRKSIVTKWVVDATGRKASVATKIDAKIIANNPLLAFYAVFVAESDGLVESDNDRRTLIEATADGWWYSSLISHSPSTRIVVFHTLPTHPAAKSSRRSDGFLERLHATSTEISGIISKWDYNIETGYPRCTAASSSYLDRFCDASNCWVAVGDAAMSFDPLSSQGMMTALEMGIYLGLQLSQRLGDSITDSDFDRRMREIYTKVRTEYEKHRSYYYSIVKRFPGEVFWETVASI